MKRSKWLLMQHVEGETEQEHTFAFNIHTFLNEMREFFVGFVYVCVCAREQWKSFEAKQILCIYERIIFQ